MTMFGSTPSNITVTCPDGYQASVLTGKCIEVAGNGYRTISEACDDNNTINDDGCSVSVIDSGWV